MRLPKLCLLVIVTLCISACLTTQSTPQTVRRVPPQVCVEQCPPLPKPENGSDRAVRVWEYDLIDAAGECARTHRACTEWVTKEQ